MANILDLAERFIESKSCMAANSKGVVAWGIKSGLITVTAPEHGADYWLSQKRRQKDKDARRKDKVERLKLKILALGGKL